MKPMNTLLVACVPLLASTAFAQFSSFCPAQANSTGSPALLTGSFGSGVGSGLHLHVTGGVPSEFGYFVVGDEATPPVVISNGISCLVGSSTSHVYRFNVGMGSEWNSLGQFEEFFGVMINLSGTSTIGTGYDVPARIPDAVPIPIAGSTWHFQYWYRDGIAGPGSSNFSNGLSVTFQPLPPVPTMVAIPAGTFLMGSDAADGAPYNGPIGPVHSVTISYPFWMGQYEVTQAEFQAQLGSNPSYFLGNPTHPVETISWNAARLYCLALTTQESTLGHVPAGYEYRLPTEAEWEYACRAGTTSEYSTGVELNCGDARFRYSLHTATPCSLIPWGTGPVGSYPPNAFGLYDMHGNVWEWCLDSYASYAAGSVVDPFVSGSSDRVYRGGSWFDGSDSCRTAYRGSGNLSSASFGFRVVLAPIRIP